ncbi:anillin [Antennarius striatus]|uniref:anillin n=1 Tax=Antennarius striatus TaxID=241820 RepID=UPI0035AE867A
MDPFTEKLLERTRARRENLQKKMAERPNALNRPTAKRPLANANGIMSDQLVDKAPQASSKPSPSKRKCSEENVQPAACEELKVKESAAPSLSDPPTDKKPPVGPASIQHYSPLEKTPAQVPVQSLPEQRNTPQPPPVETTVSLPAQPPRSREAELGPAPSAAGMRSRLQRLAEQRSCWDASDTAAAVPDYTPMSLLKHTAEIQQAPAPSVSSEAPLGRRGRLANLAATIGSWEDDLSQVKVPKENVKEKAGTAVTKLAVRESPMAASSKPTAAVKVEAGPSANGGTRNWSCQPPASSSVKANQVIPSSPRKVDLQVTSPAPKSVANLQKSSTQAAALPSRPKEVNPSPSTPAATKPLKNQELAKGHDLPSSPCKPELRAKPAAAGRSFLQDKPTEGTPGVKSFLERFEERCHERTNQCAPAGVASPQAVPSAVTPNTRRIQDRIRAVQSGNTTTADLTQRQKLERESELAKIRSRFQKGNNTWKDQQEPEETSKNGVVKVDKPVEAEGASGELQDEPAPRPTESTAEPTACGPAGHEVMMSPPASTSSPLKAVRNAAGDAPQDERVGRETEMNVDQSINSAVINGLFDGILEQEEDRSDEEEEDALNISSMSLLTPVAESVAAVVKSPGRMMTSTPASSFIVKTNTPDSAARLGKFQRATVTRTSSSESIEVVDEDPRLPYSIDAYRSTRVKEIERPNVKQVIVRREDVSHRGEEPRGPGVFNVKQKMKVLSNEMNLQQTVIHQASQALNCCTDEEHGKGSQVEAEAQRLLLVATERREALKAELDRLKGDPTGQKRAQPPGTSASKGSITLQEFRLPLKAEFVCSTANKPDATKYSFFLLIRAGVENTVATPLASTHRGLSGDTLAFPTKFNIPEASSDFHVDIEVYGLVQKRDVCSDKKKKPSKSKAITPKRFLAITKSVQTPVVASPGGPNAVRTSNFVLVGSHKLTLSSIGSNKFPLEKVPFLCPLEGHVYLKMQCEVGSEVEERGFLTMFEDVSGFGAWHRRWCVLSGYCISYWTYPDDEKRKKPIGRLSLANCTSKKVEPANREFCARPNTFELITVRPQREDDKETLVSQCQNTMCVTKNWLSADTKDERNLWMKKLNQILVDLRMWQPDACCRPQ